MRMRSFSLVVLVTMVFASVSAVLARPQAMTPVPRPSVAFAPIGTYETGLFDEGAAEIAAYDTQSQTLFVVNAAVATVDALDISDPAVPAKRFEIDVSPYGASANSVDVYGGVVAVAVENANPQEPGAVVFFDADGSFLNRVTVGALPDMLTFTPSGREVLVANEGEPNDAYSVDPEGSVSVIDLSKGVRRLRQRDVATIDFRDFNEGGRRHRELDPRIRIFGPDATVAQDLEPEYIAVQPSGQRAWVSLQENNALAEINIPARRVAKLYALGAKDHSRAGNGLDASDEDGIINIANWPVYGLYQPDAIAAYRASDGKSYLLTANEGDSRDYGGYSEEARIADLRLDPEAFPNAAELQAEDALGRLTVSTASGDLDGDGAFEELYAFGARSFSIWNTHGRLVFDSGDDFEQITAAVYLEDFNATNDANDSFDDRSDDKGPEPEGVTTGVIDGRTYAFVGLERIGGVMIYDVTDPRQPSFVQYLNNRDFSGDAEAGTAGDLGPEGLLFIPGKQSPTGKPLLVVANEISGTTTIYAALDPNGAGTLTLLHNNDGESSLLPLQNSVEPGSGYPNTEPVALDIGGVAAYKTLALQQIRASRDARNAVVNVYAGDAFLASATLTCSLDDPAVPVYDAVAQRQIPYDAHIFGNHEFDYSPDFLERFIRDFEINGVLTQPFLSANLDFGDEPGFADLLDEDGVLTGYSTDGRVVARSAIVIDKVTGQRFGIVGATTSLLPTISTPRNVTVTPDLESTARVVQREVDRLYDDYGVRKLIFVSHLQSVENDRELIRQLRHVDLAVAGGGDELLINPDIDLQTQLLPGESATVAGDYPLSETDADGRTVYIVTTAGNYKYLGRLDVEFDTKGEVADIVNEASYPRRVIPASDTAQALGIEDAVVPDPDMLTTVVEPVTACLDELAQTPVVRSEVLLDVSREGVRGGESNAGNLIADSFIAAYDRLAEANGLMPRSEDNPVIAVQNGGGIRQNAGDVLPTTGTVPGTISRLDTINVLPFDNFLTVVQEVTPEDLKTILKRSAASLPDLGGQFLQVSGFSVTYDQGAAAGSRVVDVTLADGTPVVEGGAVVEDAPALGIVTNSFTANGGDDYETFANNPNKTRLLGDDGLAVSYEQAWREYLQSFPVADGLPTIPSDDPRYQPGGEGRITIQP